MKPALLPFYLDIPKPGAISDPGSRNNLVPSTIPRWISASTLCGSPQRHQNQQDPPA